MAALITSLKNPGVKNLLALQKPRERRGQGLFIIEGIREVSLAQQSGYRQQEVWICEELYRPDPAYPISVDQAQLVNTSREVFEKLAYRESTEGVLAVAHIRDFDVAALSLSGKNKNGLYLLIESVEKPGNIGAMMRTADAAGVDGVLICDPATDLYNPNVIRSSLGTIFTLNIAICSNSDALAFFRESGIKTYATALHPKSKPYHDFSYTGPTAILVGSEASGLSDFWMQNANGLIIIPMRGKIDSMNVSNAAAVVLYEAVRQRTGLLQ